MPDLSFRDHLALVLQGLPVHIVQRGPKVCVDITGPLTATDARNLANALTPLVERLAVTRAVAALRDAATHPGLTQAVRQMLRQRATDLDGNPT